MNKKIVFMSHESRVLGGGERSFFEIIKEASSRGYICHVIVPDDGEMKTSLDKLNNVTTHKIYSSWWTINGRNENQAKSNSIALRKIIDIIDENKPFLCITNTMVNPWLACAAKITSTRHSWILREFGDLDHNLTFRLGKDNTATAISELSDKIFTSSDALKNHYEKLTNRTDIGVIYPSIPTPRKGPSKTKTFLTDNIRLLTTSNISEGKGQLDAVKAVNKIVKAGTDVELLIAGRVADKPYYDKIVEYINKNKLSESVRFIGYIDNPANAIHEADIVLVTSKSEAFGRVTIESVLCGTPVIGTDSAGTADLLGKYKKELLYNPGNISDLADKIVSLNTSEHTSKIVGSLKAVFKRKYSQDKVHEQLFKYINECQSFKQPQAEYMSLMRDLTAYQNHIYDGKKLSKPKGDFILKVRTKGGVIKRKIMKIVKKIN